MSCQSHLKHPHNDRLRSDAQQGSPHAGCGALRKPSPLPFASGTRLERCKLIPNTCHTHFTPKNLQLDEIQKSVFDTFEVSKSVGVCVGAYAFHTLF